MSAPSIYLASKSSRREALLRQLGIDFAPLLMREAPGRDRDVVEEVQDGEPPLHYVERIARTKALVGCTADATARACRRGPCSAPTPRSCWTASSSASRVTPRTRRACCWRCRAARTKC